MALNRQTVLSDTRKSVPSPAFFLATVAKRSAPEINQMMAKRTQTFALGWGSVTAKTDVGAWK